MKQLFTYLLLIAISIIMLVFLKDGTFSIIGVIVGIVGILNYLQEVRTCKSVSKRKRKKLSLD